jgi:outer membrane protein OmpA-like peptidoglycan-associated protein
VAIAIALGVAGGGLQAQGVVPTLSPSAETIRWEDGVGLADAWLYGGRLGFDFGPIAAVRGYYLAQPHVDTRLGFLPPLSSTGTQPDDQRVGLSAYGAEVLLRLSSGVVVPFIKTGGGVLRFDPDTGATFSQVNLRYGGGVQFRIARTARAEIFAEQSRFRLDRYALAPGGRESALYPVDQGAGKLRSALSIGAGVGIAIGGDRRSYGERQAIRWSVASVPIEPFAGRLMFDDDALGEPTLVGVRSGIDIGNYVGLRGFYWHGVTRSFDATRPLRSYGGEAQFNFTSVRGPAPYLIAGAGRLDFKPGYAQAPAPNPPDATALILGGGVGLRLTDQFRLNVAARDFVLSSVSLQDVASTGELSHNWLLSAGLTFSIGRGRRGIQLVRETATSAPVAVAVAPGDTMLVVAVDTARRAISAMGEREDTVVVAVRGRSAQDSVHERTISAMPDDSSARPVLKETRERSRSYLSSRTTTVPVPIEGEIYIRYGPPETPSALQPVARQSGAGDSSVVRREAEAEQDSDGSTARRQREDVLVERIVMRVNGHIDSLFRTGRAVDTSMIARIVARELARSVDSELSRVVERQVAATLHQELPALLSRELSRRSDDMRSDRPVVMSPQLAPLETTRPAAPSPVAIEMRTDTLVDSSAVVRLRARADSLEVATLRQADERAAAESLASSARDAARAAEERAAAAEASRFDALRSLNRLMSDVAEIRDSDLGLTIVFGQGLFATGSAALSGRAQSEMGAVAALLALYPDHSVSIEGHTDATGDSLRNQQLSERRAESVRLALIARGIVQSRLTTVGYGALRPIGDNGTATGRARNRRAEVIILGAQRPTAVQRQ